MSAFVELLTNLMHRQSSILAPSASPKASTTCFVRLAAQRRRRSIGCSGGIRDKFKAFSSRFSRQSLAPCVGAEHEITRLRAVNLGDVERTDVDPNIDRSTAWQNLAVGRVNLKSRRVMQER